MANDMKTDGGKMKAQTLYLVNHTHTDFGYTDYPVTLYRLHRSIIDRAIEVCEANAHLPDATRFRWTCEVAEITLDWFRHASSSMIDRFLRLHELGLMGVAGMPVHWTPLVSPALAERSLDRVRTLRTEFGLSIRTAWQCDVNGLGWFWTDLLLDAGIDRLVMASNPYRGMPDRVSPRLFAWQTPTGRSLPTLHGWHYTYGANSFRFSETSTAEAQASLDRVMARPGGTAAWPHDAMMVQVTNKASPDNGYPTHSLSDFVTRWNAEGRVPRLEIRTIDQAMDALLAKAGPLQPLSGDWPDYWADGVASTAFETTIARAGERIVPVTDMLTAASAAQDGQAQADAVQSISMYDEHTWGAYSGVTMPDAPFARFQWSWKTHQAHDGFAAALEAATQAARDRARALTGSDVENDRLIRLGDAPAIPIEEQSYYVFNPSPVGRRIRWPVPRDYGGASPATILHAWLTEEFIPGMNVQRQRRQPSATHVIDVTLPPFGEAVVRPVPVTDAPQGQAGAAWIANERWRIEIDPATGAVTRLSDLVRGRDLDLGPQGLGAMLHELPEDTARGRGAIFGSGDGNGDWTRMETISWPVTRTGYRRSAATEVAVAAPRQTVLGTEIDVHLRWPHGDTATLTWRLPVAGPGIDLTATVHKTRVTSPEAFFVVFGLGGQSPAIDLDIGDMTASAEEALPEACQSWVAIQRHATLTTDAATLVVASPDAPLVHPFGPQTEGAGQRVIRDASLGFWVINNHWDVNFAASQTGAIPFRFHLLPMDKADREAATAFAQSATTPPVIVRTYDAPERDAVPLVELISDAPLDLRMRPFGNGAIMASVVNRSPDPVDFRLNLSAHLPRRVVASAATGEDVPGDLRLDGETITGQVKGRGVMRFRIDL
jgi:alpha-mannosidase